MSSEIAPEEALRLEGVTKRYRLGRTRAWSGDLRDDVTSWLRRAFAGRREGAARLEALSGVTFGVRRGENLALIGPNGSGKSTLLKLVARITTPSEGRIQVRGRVAALIQIGAGFHAELTGRENVFLYGAILGIPRRDRRRLYDEIVAFSGLARFMDTPIKRFSQGMRMRLGVSVALHARPDVLLLDEALAVGDRAFRERCLARMEETLRGGATVLFVTHERALSERVCGRALWLDAGRVVRDGPVSEVWDAYEAADPSGRR